MIETLLADIVARPEMHARWLQTLSCLEYCGAKKISRYLGSRPPTLELLQHVAEEFRHAWFFKKQIAKLALNPDESFAVVAGALGRHYLNLLEGHVIRWLRDEGGEVCGRDVHVLTTYAIEVRAQALYAVYEKILKKYEIGFSLSSVVKEETAHLREMGRVIRETDMRRRGALFACSQESEIFKRFCQTIRSELDSHGYPLQKIVSQLDPSIDGNFVCGSVSRSVCD